MAWQLIYTSAPRSLEAGRSGFGTVARHRAISPLLVSAIERASQFSRLPGTDAGRVIFSHRIVAVAGGRFHVLSAIRDAGADYTGRTNHIAHHLIVDPREIAQLGPDGPSPADVLLAMQWAASWNEPPRFLEASDEVALSAIHPHTNGSAWEQITGSAHQAWLLATGDASRGAYIIQPGSADLRAVYAESLRLMPDRLWQISFTTSLQPSDEPGDFRWIGIEERSPLRAQSESSGRPVLNLALPDTLPLVETVQRPAVSQIRQNSEPASTPAWNDLPTASTETSPAVSGAHSSPTRQRTAITPSASSTRSSRISPKWWLLAGAVVIVLLIGAWALNSHRKVATARTDVANSFDGSFFSQDARQNIAKALVTSDDASRGKRLALASNDLVRTLYNGNLDKLKSEQTNAALEVLDSTQNQPLPSELINLRRTVKGMQDLSVKPRGVDETNDAKELHKIMTARRDEISQWDSPNPSIPLKPLIKELRANADQQQADALLRMATQRSGPVEETLFRGAVRDSGITDPVARKTIGQIEKLLGEKVAKSPPPPNPEPLKPSPPPPVEKPVTPEKPAVHSQVPLYFFNGENTFLRIKLPRTASSLRFFITEGDTPPYELSDPIKSGNLRKGMAEALFKLGHFEKSEKRILFETSPPFNVIELQKNSLKLPFRLSAQDESKAEVFQFWFVQKSSVEPLFKNKVGGLQNDGASIVIDLAMVQLPGLPHDALYLETPDDFTPKHKSVVYPLTNLRLELPSIVAPIKETQGNYLDQKDRIKIPTKDSLFEQNESLAKSLLTPEGLKKYLGRNAQNPIQRCGAMLEEYGFDLVQLGLNDVPKIPGTEMRTCGKELRDANREYESLRTKPNNEREKEYPKHLLEKEEKVKMAMKAALALSDKIQKAILEPNFDSKIKQNAIKLTPVWKMLDLASGDEKRADEVVKQPKADAEEKRSNFDELSKELGRHPLLDKGIPTGRYRLLVDFSKSEANSVEAGTKVSLLEFVIQNSDLNKK